MGDIFGSIFGFFGNLGSFMDTLRTFLGWVQTALSKVWNVLQTVWQFIVKRIIGGILQALRHSQEWLESHFKPLLDFLKKLHDQLQRYFNTYLRPLLIWLQRIRQYVHILALLHIKFAQRLDSYLANLQNKILTTFYRITAAINTLTNILLALQDPDYLIRHPVLLLSIRRQIPALIQAITGKPPGYWFPSPKGSKGGVWAPPAIPFNFRDPAQNPPASSYLGNDGLPQDLDPLINCYEYAETAVDAVQPLDYFNDDLYPDQLCPYGDPAKCLLWSWGIKS